MSESQLMLIVCGSAALFAFVCLTMLSCVCTARMVRFWPRSRRTEGVVTAAVLRMKGRESDWWALTIEYDDHTGTKHRACVNASRNPYRSLKGGPRPGRCWLVIGTHDYDVGDRVPIRYDPADPAFVVIDTFVGTWLGLFALDSLVLGFLAILVWHVGGWLFVITGNITGDTIPDLDAAISGCGLRLAYRGASIVPSTEASNLF